MENIVTDASSTTDGASVISKTSTDYKITIDTDPDLKKIIRRNFSVSEAKAIDGESGMIEVVINSGKLDRDNEVIDLNGLNFETFLEKNPVVAAFHRYDEPAVGKFVSIWRDAEKGLMGIIKFATKQYEFANTMYQLYRDGFMKAISIGIQPEDMVMDQATGVKTYTKSEMLEASVVLIGADPRALSTVKSFDPEKAKAVEEGTIHMKDYTVAEDSVQKTINLINKAIAGVETLDTKSENLEGRDKAAALEKAYELSKLLTRSSEALNTALKSKKKQVVKHIMVGLMPHKRHIKLIKLKDK